jgi:hypothetical protein
MNTDTPWPPDEPAMPNPPDGALIDYTLKTAATGPVTLEVLDSAGRLVRRYASTDPVDTPDPATAAVPLYWYRPDQRLATSPGMHRFTWDLHYQPLPAGGGRGGLPIAAVPFNTAAAPNAPWVAPGQYTVRLTVDGKSYTRPLTVKADPRVKAPAPAMAQQGTLSKELFDGAREAQAALQDLRALRAAVKQAQERAGQAPVAEKLRAFDQKLVSVEGSGGGPGGRGGAAGGADTLAGIGRSLMSLVSVLQGADAPPTTQVVSAISERRAALTTLLGKWRALRGTALVALNAELAKAGLPAIAVK